MIFYDPVSRGQDEEKKRKMRVHHLFQAIPDAELQARIDKGDRIAKVMIMKARFGQIDEALSAGIFCHSASLLAEGKEDVLNRTCSGGERPWQQGEGILEVSGQARELGVGDIVIDTENCDGWMRASIGWEVLSWDRCSKFLHIAAEKNLGKGDVWSSGPGVECFFEPA